MFRLFCWFPKSLNVTLQLRIWKQCVQKTWQQAVVLLEDENIHSGFSSESESDISIETETETETESDTDSSDSEASFMGNLQDVDRNNDEWRQVLDRDNDEPNFLNIFLCWGLQVL